MFGNEKLISNLNFKVMRGDRIGLIGNNGVGKSTLLRIMLGQLEAQSGTVKQGTNLEIAYFDQMRRELDGNKSVAEIVGNGRDYIRVNGKDRHVIGYLTGFLFSAKRAMTKVSALSGGERNRLILAKLLARICECHKAHDPDHVRAQRRTPNKARPQSGVTFRIVRTPLA